VVSFFGAYMTYTAIFKDGWLDPAPAAPAEAPRFESEIHKELPDGRVLLKDGSIRAAKPRV